MNGEMISNKERGQSFVLLAVMLIVLLGMLALIIDGGMAYAQRRSAQNAADAAALAGAEELCRGNGETAAENLARTYVYNNNAITINPDDIIATSETVEVTAHISYTTFLAGILNQPRMIVSAKASAGCMAPCSADVMPIAWACRPPANSPPGSGDCQIQTDEVTPPPIYIIMDSIKMAGSNEIVEEMYCKDPPNNPDQPNRLDCDIYPEATGGDGINDVFLGGARGWLNLNGSSCGGSELADFIAGTLTANIRIHTWLQGCDGGVTSAYNAIEDRFPGKDKHGNTRPDRTIVVMPVYDQPCDDGIPTTWCQSKVHNAPPPGWTDKIITGTANTKGYFHISKLSTFRFTCVQEGEKVMAALDPDLVGNKKTCPGVASFFAANSSADVEFKNTKIKAAEGYFVHDNSDLIGACGSTSNVGAYTVYLK